MNLTKKKIKKIDKYSLFKKQETPSYFIDESKLIKNLEKLKYIKERTNCEIYLALKAFAMPFSFKTISKNLDGCSASSIHEAKLAATKFKKKRKGKFLISGIEEDQIALAIARI